MQEKKVQMISHMDQLPISVAIVKPDCPPKAIIQILHGMTEYKELYFPFMRNLSEYGFLCIIHDHRGHGESIRTEEDYGYFYDYGAKKLVEDTNQVSRFIRNHYRNLPFFMIGHSMGSLIARAYMKQYDRVLDGVILSGNPSYVPRCHLGIHIAKLQRKLYGGRTKGIWLNKMTFGEQKEEKFILTVNGFEELYKLMASVYSKNQWHASNNKLPIWFISGEQDYYMGEEKKLQDAIDQLRKLGYENVTYKIYKGMAHELIRDKQGNKVISDIVSRLEIWLDRIS